MCYKARLEPVDLQILKFLNTRIFLPPEQKKYYFKLKKGFEGETRFDLLTAKLQKECLILNDLLLKVNNSSFQIDSTIIFQGTIYLFEVKNYEGQFCFKNNRFYLINGEEINDPLDQLKRSKLLFSQLLKQLGIHFSIEAYVVFINPEFTLYQFPPNLPVILPTQLKRFFDELNMQPSKLTNAHRTLAEKLVSLHTPSSPSIHLPAYSFEQLKKGLTCKTCGSFIISVDGKKMVCGSCGFEEGVESAILRGVEEVQLLFPNRKITTNDIHEWCQAVDSKKTVRRILSSHFKVKGHGKFSYFEKD